ncbi:MAG TPA: SDR family NAD(P)-dependent oxidoreductase, partial [Dongiaceae bacterium]
MSGDLFSLEGRVALVTGSTRSLGWAIAQGLAQSGAHVIVNGTKPEPTEARAAELRSQGHKASAA